MPINELNWTSSQYYNAPLRAFISLGGRPDGLPNHSHLPQSARPYQVEFIYIVTLANEDFQEIYQEVFPDLNNAINALNQKYGHWALLTLGQTPKDGDGCESCSAH